ncbi:hypothetical protein F2Q69_00009250 [Brassica cretica]|uniref:Uncharacterized protein n=1 Tax=Brassica cretica TaxID=69181 RepID=A0A8S9P932_BRACR|nr:hypothetical protein F2Q69_00009250 [Brassica cretica]
MNHDGLSPGDSFLVFHLSCCYKVIYLQSDLMAMREVVKFEGPVLLLEPSEASSVSACILCVLVVLSSSLLMLIVAEILGFVLKLQFIDNFHLFICCQSSKSLLNVKNVTSNSKK